RRQRPGPGTALLLQGRRVLHLQVQGGRRRGGDGQQLRPGGLRSGRRLRVVVPDLPGQRKGGSRLRPAVSDTRRSELAREALWQTRSPASWLLQKKLEKQYQQYPVRLNEPCRRPSNGRLDNHKKREQPM